MDKWLTVPPDLELFIGSALALYSLYRPKKKRWFLHLAFWSWIISAFDYLVSVFYSPPGARGGAH
jgi:hypothetical protein